MPTEGVHANTQAHRDGSDKPATLPVSATEELPLPGRDPHAAPSFDWPWGLHPRFSSPSLP